MTRSARLLLSLALAAAVIPGAVRAQEPKDNKWTKDATKDMTVASLRQKPDEQTALYQKALGTLQEGMQKDPQNAKVWLLAGEVYAQMGDLAQADSLLKKAQAMYPQYESEIEGAREQAWMKEFQKGTQALDRSQPDSAVAFMRAAESIYDRRPEAQLNLGVIYLNAGKPDSAAVALKRAQERLRGPLTAKLKPEDLAQWKAWDQLIDVTMAQIEGNKGIAAFQKQDYDSAVAYFRAAFKTNPQGRDYAYNMAESIFAKANKLEDDRRAAEDAKPPRPADVKKVDDTLAPVYQDLIAAAKDVQPFDPANTDAYIMLAKAYRGQSLAATDPKQKTDLQNQALAELTEAQKLPFEVTEVAATFGDSSSFSGKIKNHTLKAGDAAKIHVTFLALDGTVLGQADVAVPAGAPDSLTAFTAKAETKGQVAGWKYAISN